MNRQLFLFKICTVCELYKGYSEFGSHKRSSTGLRYCCRNCNNKLFKSYYKNNIRKRRLNSMNYRARKLKAPGRITKADFNSLVDKYGEYCMAPDCSTLANSLDHIVPLSLGGSNKVSNLRLLCVSCNSSKGINIIDYRGLNNECI